MDEWAKFLAHSLNKRLDADRFGKYAQLLNNKHPVPPRRVADILFRPSKHNRECFDPQIPHYVQTLLHGELLDLPAVLYALLKYSRFSLVEGPKPDAEERKENLKWNKPYIQAEGVIYGLEKVVSSGLRPKTVQEAVQLVTTLTEWAKVLAIAGPVDDMMHDTHTAEALGVRVALGTLLFAALENGKVLGVLGRSCPKGKNSFPSAGETLAIFIREASFRIPTY
jgi:mediator of RNA polymerase II transcription subunit 5